MIVLDTPPSRNALDFLDAPGRLLGFLEGRALQVFLAPGGLTARLFGRGTALVFTIFARVTGVDMFAELSLFFRSLSGVLDGFGERTRAVQDLLRSEEAAFVVVTSPEPEPVRRRGSWRSAWQRRDAPRQRSSSTACTWRASGGRSVEELEDELEPALGAELRTARGGEPGRRRRARTPRPRDDRELSELLDGRPPVLVGHLDEEVQDLLGLSRIAEQLGL